MPIGKREFYNLAAEDVEMSTQQYIVEKNASGGGRRALLRYVSWSHYSEEWNSTLHTHACAELFFITGGHGVF